MYVWGELLLDLFWRKFRGGFWGIRILLITKLLKFMEAYAFANDEMTLTWLNSEEKEIEAVSETKDVHLLITIFFG